MTAEPGSCFISLSLEGRLPRRVRWVSHSATRQLLSLRTRHMDLLLDHLVIHESCVSLSPHEPRPPQALTWRITMFTDKITVGEFEFESQLQMFSGWTELKIKSA